MDRFGMSLSQEWPNSWSQDFRSLPVPCTPSGLAFPGSSENISQQNVPQKRWNQNNFGTPANQNKDAPENQLSRKIWYGMTAVFKIVSELPETLKGNITETVKESMKDVESIIDVVQNIIKAEFEPIFSDFKKNNEKDIVHDEKFLKIYVLLEGLNSKICEHQELCEKFKISYVEDLPKRSGILLKKLLVKIKDMQTWLADFQKVQTHNLHLKYEETLKEQKEILALTIQLDKKWDLKFDTITSQIMDMKTMIAKMSEAKSSESSKTDEWHRLNLRTSVKNQFLPKINSIPLKEVQKQSPVARVLPLHYAHQIVSETKMNKCRPTKRNFICLPDRSTEEDHERNKVTDSWYNRTPDWIRYNDLNCKKRKENLDEPLEILHMKSKLKYQKNETNNINDNSFEYHCRSKGLNFAKEHFNQDKEVSISRPLSRLNFRSLRTNKK